MKKSFIIIGAALTIGLSSCENMLDIPQHGVLNYETYYNTDEEAETAVTAIYTNIRGLEYNIKLLKNLLSDEFWAGGSSRADNADLEAVNEFTFNTEHEFLQGVFESYYSIIYKANVVLGHVGEDSDVKLQMRAEAKVFRAMAYFDLISLWGNPPLVDHELDPSEYARPNGTTEELWGLVEKDLTEAIASGKLCEKTGVNDNQTWRVTKQYAQALLGKAYLWQGKNEEAADEFDKVIDSKKYDLYRGEYGDILMYNNPLCCEVLFESIKVFDKNNAWDNFSMYGVMINYRSDSIDGMEAAGLSATGWGFCVPQKKLYDAFVAEEGVDGYRLNQSIKTYEQMQEMGVNVKSDKNIINEGYFMWKWRVLDGQLPPEGMGMFVDINDMRWMRYAEVLLLAAEANLAAGRQDKADQYLNEVRHRAKLGDKTATLQAIQTEKYIELCGECCRFQDMLRWGIAEQELKNQGEKCPLLSPNGSVKYEKYNNDKNRFGFKSKHNLLPYPALEIRLNSVIKQNPGW